MISAVSKFDFTTVVVKHVAVSICFMVLHFPSLWVFFFHGKRDEREMKSNGKPEKAISKMLTMDGF